MLTPEQITFLEDNKHFWDTYKRDSVIKHYDNSLRKELFKIARVFDERANFCLHCNDDAANLLKYVYTQFEKMQKPNTTEEGVKKMTFPKVEETTVTIETAPEPVEEPKKRGRKPKTTDNE